MMRALYTAATGMLAQQTNVDNISNNLSNVNTVGFKPVSYTHLDVYKRQVPYHNSADPRNVCGGSVTKEHAGGLRVPAAVCEG